VISVPVLRQLLQHCIQSLVALFSCASFAYFLFEQIKWWWQQWWLLLQCFVTVFVYFAYGGGLS